MVKKFLSRYFNKPALGNNVLKAHFQKKMPIYASVIGATVTGGVTALFLSLVFYPEEFLEKRDNFYQSVAQIFSSDAPKQDMNPD